MNEQFSTWMDCMWSSRYLALLCTSIQSSNLKWSSGGGINSPRHQTSHWLKAAESSTIGWSDVVLFPGVGSSSATSRCPPLLMTIDTIYLTLHRLTHCRFIRAEDFAVKTLLFASSRPSDERLLHRRFIQCCCSSLSASMSWFKLSIG
jgi:hypothetical protein